MDITMTTPSLSGSSGQSPEIDPGVTEKGYARKKARDQISRQWNRISAHCDFVFQSGRDFVTPELTHERRQIVAFLKPCDIGPGESFNYEPLPSGEGATFRLLTLLPGENFEQIRCELTVATIHNAKYEALSYCWGENKGWPAIICNGMKMNVSRNLKRALKDLRYTDRPRVLWADALCINQGDLSEKASQVNLMGDIYRHAQRTIVHMHLGLETRGVGRVFAALKELHRLYQCLLAGEIDLVTIVDADELKPEGYNGRIPTIVMLLSMVSLTWHSYFKRMWIIQEVALAKNVSVSYNGYEFEWDFFKEAMVMRAVMLLETKKKEMPASLLDIFVLQLIAMREKSKKESSSQQFDLLSLLNYTRVFDSTNPLDKVYGVFGLTNTDLQAMDLRPNYTRRAEDLYLDVALGLLKESTNLDILSITGHSQATDSTSNSSLPSWVPDWSNSLYYPRSLVFRKAISMYGWPPYNASKSSVYGFSLPPGNSRERLLVRGCFHDRISDLTKIMHPASNPTESIGDFRKKKLNELSSAPFEMAALFPKIIADGVRPAMEKQQLRAFLKNISAKGSTYSPTGEPIQLAQMRTFCAGFVPFNEETSMSTFKTWLKSSWGIEHDLRYELAEVDVRIPYTGMSSRPWFGEMSCMVLGRRLLWTQIGYLGLAPPGAQEGDHVVVLEGSRVPFILRQVDGDLWKVIGECYVHGIMYGEAYDSKKCRDIILV